MDAFTDILMANGFDAIKKWVDDFIVFAFGRAGGPPDLSPENAFAIIERIAADLGIPLHPKKRQLLGTIITYVGFTWNLKERSVGIPPDKKAKYLAKLDAIISAIESSPTRSCRLKPLLSVHGSLMHCTFVVRAGRGFLIHIQRFLTRLGEVSEFKAWKVNDDVMKELRWWRSVLSQDKVERSLRPAVENDQFEFWVDASKEHGIGIVCRLNGCRRWDAWRWKAGVFSHGRNIGWAEVIGLEFVIYAAKELGLRDARLRIRGDNMGAIHSLKKLACRNIPSNDAIIRITQTAAPLALSFDPIYVNTKFNLADGPSRGSADPLMPRHRFGFAVPDCLQPFLDHV